VGTPEHTFRAKTPTQKSSAMVVENQDTVTPSRAHSDSRQPVYLKK